HDIAHQRELGMDVGGAVDRRDHDRIDLQHVEVSNPSVPSHLLRPLRRSLEEGAAAGLVSPGRIERVAGTGVDHDADIAITRDIVEEIGDVVMGSFVPDRRAAIAVHPHQQHAIVRLLEGEIRVPITVFFELGQACHSLASSYGDVRDGAPGCDRSGRSRSGSPPAASRPPPRTTPSTTGAAAAGAARRPRACCRAETGRSRRWPPRRAERPRRRTPAAPPSSSAVAAPIARTRVPDTTWRPTVRTLRTRAEEAQRSLRRLLRAPASVGVDPVAHRLVEVAHEDLLIVEGKLAERALLESHLRAVERSHVLQTVLLERERGVLVRQALAGAPRGHEVEVGLEHVRVVRRRPVSVRDEPTALVDQDLEIREDLEIVDAPAGDARRVDARKLLAEVRRVPRPRVAATGERLGGVEMLPGPILLVAAAPGVHAVRPVELIGRTPEPVLRVLRLGSGTELVRMERWNVVVLLERVAEHLPVAVVLGAKGVALGHPVEGVAFEGPDHRTQVVPQRLARLAREVHENETGPGVAVHRGEAQFVLAQIEELVLLVDVRARAVEAVPPAVVLADELPGVAAGLVTWRFLPQQLVAAVPAYVVEGSDPALHVA